MDALPLAGFDALFWPVPFALAGCAAAAAGPWPLSPSFFSANAEVVMRAMVAVAANRYFLMSLSVRYSQAARQFV